jgi:hypothetical protein
MATSEHENDGVRLADEIAAEFGRAEVRTEPAAPARGPRVSPSSVIVAVASVAVMLVQIPALRAAFAPLPSLHDGAASTDAGTEQCIDALWRISALVQQGESKEAIARLSIREPLTHAPYAVSKDGGALVVECPNPAAHGLKRLRVRSDAPVPEASR